MIHSQGADEAVARGQRATGDDVSWRNPGGNGWKMDVTHGKWLDMQRKLYTYDF